MDPTTPKSGPYASVAYLSVPIVQLASTSLAEDIFAETDEGTSERRLESSLGVLDDWRTRAVLTVDELRVVLGLGRSAAYDAVRRGDIPSRRLNGRIVIPVPALLRWLGGEEAR